MATTGTYVWTQTRDTIIKNALRKLAVLPSGGTPSANQVNDANDALNALIKAFEADGMPIWAVQEYSFTTVAGTNQYLIGVNQTLNTVSPLKILQAQYTLSGGSPVPMNIYNRYDYKILPKNSSITGTPVSLYYQPSTNGQQDVGTINLWPYPSDSTTTITIQYQRPFQDVNASSDNVDFPAYWIQALIYNLAWVLAPEYGIPPADRGILQQEANYWHTQALSFGTEEGSIYIQPNKSYTR